MKRVILVIPLLIAALFCACNKYEPCLVIEKTEKAVDYFENKNIYVDYKSNEDRSEILVENNGKITVTVTKLSDEYAEFEIICKNEYADKNSIYSNIDYSQLADVSNILCGKNINAETIEKACSDKRDFYDNTDPSYQEYSETLLMSKIYRVGFFENPTIFYNLEMSYGNYSETVTISGQCG